MVKNKFSVLKHMNQSARLYGINLSCHMPLAQTAWNQLGLKGLLNYTKGSSQDTGESLYVSTMRSEIKTPGYGLLNLRGNYSWKTGRLDFGAENLFDSYYHLPTGSAYTDRVYHHEYPGIAQRSAVGRLR